MMSRFGLVSVMLSLPVLGGGCMGGMDGTWVFQWDQKSLKEVSTYQDDDDTNSTEGPDCVSSGDYPVRDLGGTSNSFVEIYLTQGTGIVVSMDGQELIGDVSANTFEVEASYKQVVWTDEDEYEQLEWLMTLDGILQGGEIDGQLDFKSINGTGFPAVECLYQSRLDYNAVKLTTESRPDRGLGTSSNGGSGVNVD